MDIQIKSSRVVLATDSAVSKLKELKDAENADEKSNWDWNQKKTFYLWKMWIP